jgi:hypothetical protein
MAGKADFTPDEWSTLHRGATGAGLLVSMSDPGFFDTFKEAGALGKLLQDQHKGSPSQLVRELTEERGTGYSMGTSPQQLEPQVLDALRSAVSVLDQKAPAERDAYSGLVLAVAEAVASAVKGVSPSETGAMDKIKAALGTT